MATTATDIVRSAPRALRINTFVWLELMMLFCVGLSLFFLSGQSLRLDEAQSLWQSGRSVPGILNLVAEDVHVPLYHVILHYWRLVLGDGVLTARLLSLLFYLASIPALYALGELAYSRKIGLFAALLLTVSPFMNWYGNEIRMYTLFTFLTILNQYFFISLWKRSDHWSWLGYFATALLGVYSHYFFFVVLTVQAVFYLFRRDLFPKGSFVRLAAVALIVLVAFAPWAWDVWSQGLAGNQEPVLPAPTTVNLFSTFAQFLFGFQDDHLNTFMLSLWPIAVILGLLSLRKNMRPSLETEYFVTTILVSVAVMFVGSLLVQPVFVSRYLIFTVPSLFLVLSSVFNAYAPRLRRVATVGLVSLMLIMLAVEIWSPATPVKEDYRAATDYLNTHAAAQDVVVVSAPFTLYPVEYYYRGDAPLSSLPIWNQYAHGAIPAYSASELQSDATTLTNAHQYLWLLLSYDQGYNADVKDYFDTHYERVFEKNFSPGLDLYVYKLRYDTPLSKRGLTLQ